VPIIEEVYVQEYRDFAESEENLVRFIDDVYNAKRLHRAPAGFESAGTLKLEMSS